MTQALVVLIMQKSFSASLGHADNVYKYQDSISLLELGTSS